MATNMEKWNKIVERFNWLDNNGQPRAESYVQTEWEGRICPEILGYRADEVTRPRVQMGAVRYTDIVLKKGDLDLCVIELKKTNNSNARTPRDQLFSYILQMGTMKMGVLAGDKLHVYYYDYTNREIENNERPNIEIPFESDNEDGAKFVELFSRDNFNQDNILHWINEHYEEIRRREEEQAALRVAAEERRTKVAEIRSSINDNLVKELLKTHFSNGEVAYAVDVIEEALQGVVVSVQTNEVVEPDNNVQGNAARQKYIFNGQSYSMGKLALAVVKKYVELNPTVTWAQLSETFSQRLNFDRKPIVRRLADVTAIEIQHNRVYNKRADLIRVVGENSVCVSTQWSNNKDMPAFLALVQRLGFTVTRE